MLEALPLGTFAVTTTGMPRSRRGSSSACVPRAGGEPQRRGGYPLAPHYLVHVGDDGTVVLPYTQAKQILDRLKRSVSVGICPTPAPAPASTRQPGEGEDMRNDTGLLAAAVASVVGKGEERAVASLFSAGRNPCHEGRIRRGQRF